VSLKLTEVGVEHVSSAAAFPPDNQGQADAAGSPDLRTLRALAESCGARADAHLRRAPTNIARNYYDAGRDFDVSLTVTLTFGSAAGAVRFLADADPTFARWLARGRAHAARLSVGEAELVLAGTRQQSDALLSAARRLLLHLDAGTADDGAD